MTPASRPWRDGLAAGVAAALIAGLVVALVDAAAAGFGTLPIMLGLWAPPALAMGVLTGLVIAGVRASFGDGALGAAVKRLRGDRELDLAMTGAVLAGLVVAGVLTLLIAKLAMTLVADVQRKGQGALLLGVAVVAVVPLVAMLGFPLYRVTRLVAAAVPTVGPLPRVVALVVIGAIGVVAIALIYVFTKLDWQVLGLGAYGLFGGLFVGTLALLGLGFGPLDGVRRAIPARGVVAAVGAVLAVVVPLLTLRGAPSRANKTAVIDESIAGAKLVAAYSGFFDRDHDGYSSFFDGPDCNDGNPKVNPKATEVAGNGIDDNCKGGDRTKKEKKVEPGTAGAGTGSGTGTGTGTVPAAKAVGEGMNVLIVMIDTVRADRLGVAGYKRDDKSMTPRIDGFAGQSMRFTHAYTQASNTPRAMPAFMTSRYPSVIKVDNLFENYPILHDDNLMLFEAFKQAGLATFGFSAHFYFHEKRNFGQGFDLYDNDNTSTAIAPSNHDIASPRIVPKVTAKLAELGTSGERFAMWVHLFEPHSTYLQHEGPDYPKNTNKGTESHKFKYDYEILFQDGFVGQIFDAVDQAGLAKNTIVVVVSDHGEAFAVHRFAGTNMMFHGQTLYEELLHIPLMIRIPGLSAGTADSVVQLIDVAPTLLDALGIAAPPSFMGRSLVPALRGEPLEPLPSFSELIPYKSWRHEGKAVVSPDAKWHMFDRISDKKVELYDLVNDPEERKDVYTSEPERAKELEQLLLDFVEVTLAPPEEETP